jgi:hypothetical protein
VQKRPIKIRKFWKINPRLRIKQSKKIYSRARAKLQAEREPRDEE